MSDKPTPILRRSFACEIRADEQNKLRVELSASSEFEVKRGGYAEILDHSPGAMRNIASSVLFNHDPDQLIGSISESGIGKDKTLRASIALLADARLPTGVLASDAVAAGALRGVSIGYSIDKYTRTEQDGMTRIRATAWTLREISLTPIPADPTVGIGRSEDDAAFAALFHVEETPATPAENTTERIVSDTTKTEPQVPAVATIPPVAAPAADPVREADVAAVVAMRALGIDPKEAALGAIRKNAASTEIPAVAQVRVDESDKIKEEAVSALLAGRSAHDTARRFAIRHQVANAGGWDKGQSTEYILGRTAETSANFNQVTVLATQKAMIGGYESYTPWSTPLVEVITASDFKTVRVAGLQVGDFSEPAEGSAFSDLTIDDNLTGSGALTFRGAGIELTKQAIYNDELGLFFRKMQQVGVMAARHQDIKVAAAIEAASFANASLGTGVLAAATLATAWANFLAFTGPASQVIGVLPKFLVVPPALWNTAASLLTLGQGGAATAGLAGVATSVGGVAPFIAPMQPVVGLHLSSASAYYLAADPMQAGGFTVVKHVDYITPQVFEVDAGLVASRKFRIEFPMAVISATSATGKPVGWGKSNGTA